VTIAPVTEIERANTPPPRSLSLRHRPFTALDAPADVDRILLDEAR
jgi:hypothetical protein